MTPTEFITKWKVVALTERATAQSHFLDLCSLFGHEDPVKADPKGDWFTFEKGVTKAGGGNGFADVWKRNYFAWEYKKKKKNLDDALAQLVRYASALEKPQWLADAHRDLDETVAAAYGWPSDISDEDVLAELLSLNVARTGVVPVLPGESHVIGRSSFDKINEVEGLKLSESMKNTFLEFDREGQTTEERRRSIKERLKQITR
jgi:hypothetical protein